MTANNHSLSTSSMMVTSLVPMLLVAEQMYSPESWRPTVGSTRLLFSRLCLQGSGDRSLDQVIVGGGRPTIADFRVKTEVICSAILLLRRITFFYSYGIRYNKKRWGRYFVFRRLWFWRCNMKRFHRKTREKGVK